MANEIKVVWGTPKTLEANGASIANNAIAQADDASYDIVADGLSYPDAEFVATLTFGTAPTENTTVDLFAQALDIDGTTDEQSLEATYKPKRIASFLLNNVTSAQTLSVLAYDVPVKASYWLYNNASGQTLSAGWTLKVTPRSVGPA